MPQIWSLIQNPHIMAEHPINLPGFIVRIELSMLHVKGSFFFFFENTVIDQNVFTFLGAPYKQFA